MFKQKGCAAFFRTYEDNHWNQLVVNNSAARYTSSIRVELYADMIEIKSHLADCVAGVVLHVATEKRSNTNTF
jgi:hypothetical protein